MQLKYLLYDDGGEWRWIEGNRGKGLRKGQDSNWAVAELKGEGCTVLITAHAVIRQKRAGETHR